jgi:hypothetical protein
MKRSALWNITPYIPLKINIGFGVTCCYHPQGKIVIRARKQYENTCCLSHVILYDACVLQKNLLDGSGNGKDTCTWALSGFFFQGGSRK